MKCLVSSKDGSKPAQGHYFQFLQSLSSSSFFQYYVFLIFSLKCNLLLLRKLPDLRSCQLDAISSCPPQTNFWKNCKIVKMQLGFSGWMNRRAKISDHNLKKIRRSAGNIKFFFKIKNQKNPQSFFSKPSSCTAHVTLFGNLALNDIALH